MRHASSYAALGDVLMVESEPVQPRPFTTFLPDI